MAKIRVTYGRTIPIGRVPEVHCEATYEDEIPQGESEHEFYEKCWQIVEREVEGRFAKHIDESRPRCELCGKVVETLFSMWDEDSHETVRLCYEDYTKLENKRLSLSREQD
jgi:hypothetical protein